MLSMKMAAMKLGNTPKLAAWSPSLASFPPPTLIFATNSSHPSSCGGEFLVKRGR
jgi:hypothetical protein